MTNKKEFEMLLEYEYAPHEVKAAKEVIKYIEEKYGVEVYKCVFRYDDHWYFEGDRTGEVTFIKLHIKTTNQEKRITRSIDGRTAFLNFPEDEEDIKKILSTVGMPKCSDKCRVLYSSFETEAVGYCYSISMHDFKNNMRDKYFNPNTMKDMNNWNMVITYKTKELWEEAEKNGQNERFKREYFEFIKKYDHFGFITMDKHLIAVFDYPEIALSGYDASDRYWGFIQEE